MVVMTVTILLRKFVELCSQRVNFTTWKNFNVLQLSTSILYNIRQLLKLFTTSFTFEKML